MSASADFSNPLRKFKLVFLGEQSGEFQISKSSGSTVVMSQLITVPPEQALHPNQVVNEGVL